MYAMRALGYTPPSGTFYTPGAILAESDKVASEASILDTEIGTFVPSAAEAQAFAVFRSGWTRWLTDWKAYRASLEGVGGWLSRTWGGTMQQIADYGRDLNGWRAKFEGFAGAYTSLPTPGGPSSRWGWWLLAGLLGAGALYGGWRFLARPYLARRGVLSGARRRRLRRLALHARSRRG